MEIFVDKNFQERLIDDKTFVNVCNAEDIFEKKGVKIQFEEDDDMQVALFKFEGEYFCLENICPHRHQAKIHAGYFRGENIMCPEHGWTYSIKSGMNVNQKQGKKNLKKYDVFEEEGRIWIEKPPLHIPKWRQT